MHGTVGNIAKVVFLGTAAILVILGIVLCAWAAAKVASFNKTVNSAFQGDSNNTSSGITIQTSAAIIAAIGIITVLIVTIGCFGAFKEKRILLGIYIPILLVLFICVLGCVIALYASKSQSVQDSIRSQMNIYNPSYGDATSVVATRFIDTFQNTMVCCGVDSYRDWQTNSYLVSQGMKVPVSCCGSNQILDHVACTKNPDAVQSLLIGCSTKLNPFGKDVGVVAIIIAIIMLLNLLSSCAVCTMIGPPQA